MAVDVGFEVLQRADGTVRVRTTGLGRHGRPEIELSEVDSSQVDLATDLLGRVAASFPDSPVYAGQTMAVAADISVELQESEHLPAGFLARALGASDRVVMRVTDAGRRTANGVMCAAARLRARELHAVGDDLGAARLLNEALEAARADDDSVSGERALAALDLSRIEADPNRALDLLLEALRASTEVQIAELGATFAEIARFGEARLVDEMRHIATVNLGLVDDREFVDNTVRVVPSPIWQRAEGGRAELGMTMIPGPWLRLYWHGATRVELQSGLAPAIAGEVFTALAQSERGIARLAYIVRETSNTFPLTVGAPRGAASPGVVAGHVFLASAVLAHVARQRTADMSRDEIHAAFGIGRDARAAEIALDKGRRLRVRLAQWTRDGRAR